MPEGIIVSIFIAVYFFYRNKQKIKTTFKHTGYQKTESTASHIERTEVIRIIDGDTVIISKGWRKITIRLDSIDCPEDGQYWGDIAKYGLIKLIGGQKIQLEEHGLDCYGRTLATIYVKNIHKNVWLNVNERMVTIGHAWVMRKFYNHLPKDRQAKLNRLEYWAKSKKNWPMA